MTFCDFHSPRVTERAAAREPLSGAPGGSLFSSRKMNKRWQTFVSSVKDKRRRILTDDLTMQMVQPRLKSSMIRSRPGRRTSFSD